MTNTQQIDRDEIKNFTIAAAQIAHDAQQLRGQIARHAAALASDASVDLQTLEAMAVCDDALRTCGSAITRNCIDIVAAMHKREQVTKPNADTGKGEQQRE